MKVWKRCLAALLAFIMIGTSVNISSAAGTLDEDTNIWSATAADIVAEYYGLTANSRLEAVMSNGALKTGTEYQSAAPYNNDTADKKNLIAVDYLNHVFYVRSYETDGYTWLPVEAVLVAEGEVKETYPLTEGVCFYNNEEYYASEEFEYTGNSYTVQVTYQTSVIVDAAEQQRLLEIPAHLGQLSKNIEKTLSGMWYNLHTFGEMIPALYSMLEMEIPAEEPELPEPFFDEEEHAEEIAVIKALYEEYMTDPENPGLQMFAVSDESLNTSDSGLVYGLENGAKVRDTSAALYDKLLVLAESSRLNKLYGQLKNLNPDLDTSLKNLYRQLNGFVGTASKEGTLEILKKDENWSILDPEVQARVFKEEYDEQDYGRLEQAVYELRNVSYTVPQVQGEILPAARVKVSCQITTYDVVVTAYAKTVGDGVGNSDLKDLTPYTAAVTLLKGTAPEIVEEAVRNTGIEAYALNQWNALSGIYQINTGNYIRTKTEIRSPLTGDVPDYGIWYEPNEYTVQTDYAGRFKVPYGYQLELPASTNEDGWYDYSVEAEGESPVTYNQGLVYTVTRNVKVKRSEGTAKLEYRVLDFLAEDKQYQMSDASKRILLSSAIDSPIVKIRVPDGNAVGAIQDTGSGFYVEAARYPSGMSGVVWEPYALTLMDGDSPVQEISFTDGKASWSTAAFTHANIHYRMNITGVKDGFGSRPLTAEEISEYVNLPYTLVQEAAEQNQVLGGDSGVTAKTVYQNMKAYQSFMGLFAAMKDIMETDEGKNAVLRIQGSEYEQVTGVNGEKLGYGGWSATSEEAAIFKYLRMHEEAGWSLAAYYQMGNYDELAEQCLLMAECLTAVVDDPGCISLLEMVYKNNPDELTAAKNKLDKIRELTPELEELAYSLKGPNRMLKVNDPKFAVLIQELLASEGKTQYYSNTPSIQAYSDVRKNGANAGSILVTVQVGNYAKTATLGYALDVVYGSEKYHIITEGEAASLQNIIAELKESCGLETDKEIYYDQVLTEIPAAGDKVTANESISLMYTPKTYTVTIDGVSASDYKETFQYGSDYVITLPAKSQKPTANTTYRYTLLDAEGNVMELRTVQNGTTGSYRFKESDLPALFPAGGYIMYREEITTPGKPGVTLKPKLTPELIRGAEVDEKNKILYLDVKPDGITKAEFVKNVVSEANNASLQEIRVFKRTEVEIIPPQESTPEGGSNPEGETPEIEVEITETDVEDDKPVGTDMIVQYILKDSYGKEEAVEYKIVLMGDVNGDGCSNDSDIQLVMSCYFVDSKDKDAQPVLTGMPALAANMNNNKKIDSNDAWMIRGKSLYWNGDKKQNQIIYRSVLK